MLDEKRVLLEKKVMVSKNTGGKEALRCGLAEGSRIRLIGLGGIGCIVLHHLALFLNSLNLPLRLTLVDGDAFEPRNAERMHFDTLGNKAEVKAKETAVLIGRSDVMVVPVPEYLSPDNIARLIGAGDHVMLCVDNHPTRRLVSEHCQTLSDVVLFSGGNDGVAPPREQGTYGNVQVAIRRDGRDVTVPITRYHPEIARAEGEGPGKEGCGQLVESVPQIQFTNLMAASWMLSAFFAYSCGCLEYQEVKFDILEGRALPQFPLEPGAVVKPIPVLD